MRSNLSYAQPPAVSRAPDAAARQLSDAEIAGLAFTAYRTAPPLVRALQALRPAICPLERLVREIPPGSELLDVGCGAGLLLLAAAASGRLAAGHGVDISERAIGAARRAFAEPAVAGDGVPITFQCSTGLELPEGPFDVVTLIDVMHHVPPGIQRTFFALAAARVRPGGLLVYKDMCHRPRWKAWGNRLHDLVLARQWIHYVPLEHICTWAGGLGFAVRSSERYSRFWYGHELLVLERE